ncbi:MAG: hypothetical protein COT15_02320 [Candidatus Diapherotrites archaeon CG08_land_8_20_14_0_20_34_12]|nr:MAG: hypothetical protein COT15_02320 [Candidatus Diapherotrites archaeon CG08_land_8_20_14_0_20_34_12]
MSAYYLNIEKEQQKQILGNLKEKLGFSWAQLAKSIGVSRGMIFLYNRGKNRIPYLSLIKLCEIAKLDLTNYSLKIIDINNKTKHIHTPPLTEDLAEFLGILSGDGCLTKPYCTAITCNNLVDKYYVKNRVRELCINLFQAVPTIRVQKNAIHIRVYSKELFNFLKNKYDFPEGLKKNKLKIPIKILQKEKLVKAFLRGVFDTDGSFHKHHKNTAAIEITSASKTFLEEIRDALSTFGFSVCLSGISTYIYDSKQIDLFFKKIKPNNLKHIYKYNFFKKKGYVPTHNETIAAVV